MVEMPEWLKRYRGEVDLPEYTWVPHVLKPEDVVKNVPFKYEDPLAQIFRIIGYCDILTKEKFTLEIDGNISKAKIRAIIDILHTYANQIEERQSQLELIKHVGCSNDD